MNFYLNVLSMKSNFFSGIVKKIHISSTEGELGIYSNHSPLLTLIKPCKLYILDKNNIEEYIYVSGGILEIQPKNVSILADKATKGVDLNYKKIIFLKNKFQNIIKKSSKIDKNFLANSLALLKIKVQLKVIELTKNIQLNNKF
ncbi:ATP synthase F1 subunit epsilon [Buchnera aphidicola (Neophyllaphis podocarpi)]|uniref:ATP synthase F1 subunit epsilon n=1 Tax=Buchnera aphidicola TaxID=9 RepID=UPI0031B7FF61